MFVFGSIAGISTDGMPQAVFYLGGITLWNYFPLVLLQRRTPSLRTLKFLVRYIFPESWLQWPTFWPTWLSWAYKCVVFWWCFVISCIKGSSVAVTKEIYLLPILIIMMAGLSLGIGIIISSLTTKYRDFKKFYWIWCFVVNIPSPVIYPFLRLKTKTTESFGIQPYCSNYRNISLHFYEMLAILIGRAY